MKCQPHLVSKAPLFLHAALIRTLIYEFLQHVGRSGISNVIHTEFLKKENKTRAGRTHYEPTKMKAIKKKKEIKQEYQAGNESCSIYDPSRPRQRFVEHRSESSLTQQVA